ncbi:2-methylthioadenine synthetase [Cellvibrio sp. BR]|uniref:SAVED domain-containing protein n=1 Tax=Cellvibrio sp. BR TaxID=1134474 RepID=UPI00026012FB|nr:SAVED domain-containing protein [Cellvibrio sp. BR]EIK44780.1 2-methylthioadenine synthetase [Cellvibrio sp. BR]
MQRHLDNFIAGAIDWLWRKRSPGLTLIRISITVLLALLGTSWAMKIIVPSPSGTFQVAFDMNQGIPAYLIVVSLVLTVILFVVGIILLILEERNLGKKRAIAIELRGLRYTTGQALKDKIPRNILGRRDQILVNIIRSDGRILDPEEALQQIIHLPTSMANIEAGVDRTDIAFVAGGLAPVPFSFLMGIQLDDESGVTLMDWDRNGNYWRALDGKDDGCRFVVSGMDKVGEAEEIVLSASVSYHTNLTAVTSTFSGQPIVSMTLTIPSTDGHWSEAKQAALAQEFFNTARALCGTNVKRVNLILAAPNSVVIRFGRIYDKRNLPALTVWQYENGQNPPYPWGVSMPVAGQKAKIIRRSNGELN